MKYASRIRKYGEKAISRTNNCREISPESSKIEFANKDDIYLKFF